MTTQAAFLSRISAKLGRTAPNPANRPTFKPAEPLKAVGPTDPNFLADYFTTEAQKMGAKIYRISTEGEIAQMVINILKEANVQGTVVRWDDPTLTGLGLDEALKAAGNEVVPFYTGGNGRALVETAERSVAGITGVDAAIAETGTLVMGSNRLGEADAPGRGRTVSLLPPIHIAVLRKEQIVFSSISVFRRLSAGSMPSQVIFATGPSRSADIENDLSIGVHGPCQLHIILV